MVKIGRITALKCQPVHFSDEFSTWSTSYRRLFGEGKVFDKIQTVQPGTIVDNKRLSAVLEQVEAQQAAYPARQQRGHAARQRPPNNLDAPALPSKGRAPRHGAAAAAA